MPMKMSGIMSVLTRINPGDKFILLKYMVPNKG